MSLDFEPKSLYKSEHYILQDFQQDKLEQLFKFKQENLFTDVYIYVEGVEFPCHKVILCSSSLYFQAMFTCDLKESRLGKVYIENMSPWTMKRLLDFIYTGKIEINYENVIDLFNAAVLFQLYKLVDKCINFVQHNIDLNNCIEINLFASIHNLKDLETQTFKFILENFMNLINQSLNIEPNKSLLEQLNCKIDSNSDSLYSSFVRLNEKTFLDLIKSDLLNINKEIYVYIAINKWTEFYLSEKSDNKLKYLILYENLFKCLRLSALNKSELEFILKNDKFLNEKLKNLIKQHLNDSLLRENNNLRPSTLPREHLCLLHEDKFKFYDFYKSKWTCLNTWPRFDRKLLGYSTSVVKNLLYITGGCFSDENDTLNLVNTNFRFDPVKNDWQMLKPMPNKRAYHTTKEICFNKAEHFLFVFYGINELNSQCLNIEFYNIEKDEWGLLGLNNSLLNHQLFNLYNQFNRQNSLENETLVRNNLIKLQLNQARCLLTLKNLLYLLNESCIHCYEFDLDQNEFICLPYFRLPKTINQSYILCKAISLNTSNILIDENEFQSKSLFTWYSDIEEEAEKLNNDLEASKSVLYKQEKEALIYILNPEQGLIYEFYPAKNKLLKLPNLLLKHIRNESYILKFKNKICITGGCLNENDSNGPIIEQYDIETKSWKILINIDNETTQTNLNEYLNDKRNFFKLKMSLS